jgi:ACT domain-containing protein
MTKTFKIKFDGGINNFKIARGRDINEALKSIGISRSAAYTVVVSYEEIA